MNSSDDIPTPVKTTKMDIKAIPIADLKCIVDVRPNPVTRGVLFLWDKRYVMTVLDSNVDFLAPTWELTTGLVFPEETTPVMCVQAFFGWATMCVFDPVEAAKQLNALMPDEYPTIN